MTWFRRLRGRRFQRGSQAALSVGAFLGILVLINVLAAGVLWRYDATASSLYSLSEHTQKVLANLKATVAITAFVRDDLEGAQVRDFLRQYGRTSRKVSVRFVNPLTSPSVARQHKVERFNTIIVEAKGRRILIEPTDLFVASEPRSVQFRGEQPVTQAIIRLTSETKPKVYFLQGHGELPIEGRDLFRLTATLKGEGFSPVPLSIGESGFVPADAALVVATGPRRDLLSRERELLVSYVRGGGRLIILLDPLPGAEQLKEWKALIGSLGLEAHEDIVVDPERAFFMDPMALNPKLYLHSITKGILKRRLPVVLYLARSFGELEEKSGVVLDSLLVTSDAAWGETDLTNSPRRDKSDLAGPLTVAVAVSRPVQGAPRRSSDDLEQKVPGDTPPSEQRRLAVVIGNSQFVRDDALDFPGNLDFFMNSVNWLLGQDNLITTRPKYMELRPANLTPIQATRVFYGTVVVMPLLPAVAGLAVWWRRRWL